MPIPDTQFYFGDEEEGGGGDDVEGLPFFLSLRLRMEFSSIHQSPAQAPAPFCMYLACVPTKGERV